MLVQDVRLTGGLFYIEGNTYGNTCTTPPCGCVQLLVQKTIFSSTRIVFGGKLPRHSHIRFVDSTFENAGGRLNVHVHTTMVGSIVEFVGGKFSHTWGDAEDDVTMFLVISLTASDKSLFSFQKVHFEGKQTVEDKKAKSVFRLKKIGGATEENQMKLDNSVFEISECTVTLTGGSMTSLVDFESDANFNAINDGSFLVQSSSITWSSGAGGLLTGASINNIEAGNAPFFAIINSSVSFKSITGSLINVKKLTTVGAASKSFVVLRNSNITAPSSVPQTTLLSKAITIPTGTSVGLRVYNVRYNDATIPMTLWRLAYASASDQQCDIDFPFPGRPQFIACEIREGKLGFGFTQRAAGASSSEPPCTTAIPVALASPFSFLDVGKTVTIDSSSLRSPLVGTAAFVVAVAVVQLVLVIVTKLKMRSTWGEAARVMRAPSALLGVVMEVNASLMLVGETVLVGTETKQLWGLAPIAWCTVVIGATVIFVIIANITGCMVSRSGPSTTLSRFLVLQSTPVTHVMLHNVAASVVGRTVTRPSILWATEPVWSSFFMLFLCSLRVLGCTITLSLVGGLHIISSAMLAFVRPHRCSAASVVYAIGHAVVGSTFVASVFMLTKEENGLRFPALAVGFVTGLRLVFMMVWVVADGQPGLDSHGPSLICPTCQDDYVTPLNLFSDG